MKKMQRSTATNSHLLFLPISGLYGDDGRGPGSIGKVENERLIEVWSTPLSNEG